MTDLQAPFPYFGGKATVASDVWSALGDAKHYIEPFFGSGAVLLNRPNHDPTTHLETVNDKDCLLANVWRAIQADPDEVARWCDWPVNHADLNARRVVLNAAQPALAERMGTDPDYFDAKLAGYWVWAASCWIGSGLTCKTERPHLTNAGSGVHKLGKRPHVGKGGMGVHKISLANQPDGETPDPRAPYNPNIYAWMRRLSERLRTVRVVCGDWTRVCGGDWQDNVGTVGIFFDPPYGIENRDKSIYAEDSLTVSYKVAEWAIARGDRPSYRIVIAGYDDEHPRLIEAGWRTKQWSAMGGYGNTANTNKGQNQGAENRHREMLFFSPHCLRDELPLFGGLAALEEM